MDRDTVLEDMTVIVQGRRIAALGAADAMTIPDGARVIDGTGRYLAPGLMDAHVHLDSTAMSTYLAHGITTVRNMIGASSDLRLREHVNAGAMIGPTVRTATPYFTTQPAELSWHTDTPERAREGVRRFAHEGYDWITVVRLEEDVLEAVVDEARKYGLSVGGHIQAGQSFDRFIGSGIDSWEHLKELIATAFEGRRPSDADLVVVADRLRTADVTVSTILGHALVVSNMYRLREAFLETEQSRRLSRLQDAEQYGYRADLLIQHIARMPEEQRARSQVYLSEALRVIKARHDGGVNLVPGTDSNTEYAMAGVALHEEMELLIAAGLTPYEVLRTATVNSARLLGVFDRLGTIEVGKDANLILVGANPLDGLTTLRAPSGVMVNGRYAGAGDLEATRATRGS